MKEKNAIYDSIPGALPKSVFNAIIRDLGHNPKWTRRLSLVAQRWEDDSAIRLIRVFDETIAAETGVDVIDYKSLDSHPELVIFEGWFDKNSDAAWLF